MLFLLACAGPQPADDGPPAAPPSDTASAEAAWTLLVYIAGDNDLEPYVVHDLNELEVGHPNPGGNSRPPGSTDRSLNPYEL